MPLVQMIGKSIDCPKGKREGWREVAGWLADQLKTRYGDAVAVEYFDLSDPACPVLPEGAQVPVVLIDGVLFSSGGKISLPEIRRQLEVVTTQPVP